MLLGLISPTSGSATIFGKSIAHPAAYIDDVGALIESPAFYPKLTGEQNLRTLAVFDNQPTSRIAEVLEIVGLQGREGDRVREYSLGMKQRLGIAAALLRDPGLLVLDEPTNGLDPAGIVEIREMMQSLAASGTTVLISSHLLAEIQAMVDHVVIINKGKLVFEGGLPGLLAEAAHEVIAIPDNPDDTAQLAQVLTNAHYTVTIDDDAVHITGAVDEPASVNKLAFASGITLAELRVHREDLEDVFLRLTDGEGGL